MDDGQLDVCVYEGRGRWDTVRLATLTLLRRHQGSSRVQLKRVRHLRIASEKPFPAQLDGEALADSPAEVSVAAGALWVMTPRRLRSPLFSLPPAPP